MIRLRPLPQLRLFQLDEVADVRAFADVGVGPNLRERADLRRAGNARLADDAEIVDDHAIAQRRVDDPDAGVNLAATADDRLPFEVDARVQDRVGADDHVGLNPGGGGVENRDPGGHQRVVLAVAQDRRRLRQLLTAVYAQDLPWIRDAQGLHPPSLAAENADQVGKIVLTLSVCRSDLPQRREQRFEVESVDTAVDLVDFTLCRAGVLVLDDRRNRAIRPDDAAVAVRLGEFARSGPWPSLPSSGGGPRAPAGSAGRISGTSPDRSSIVPALPPRCGSAWRTAWPVPSCGS